MCYDKLGAFIDLNGKYSEISTPTRSHTLHVPGEKYTLLGIGPKALWLVSYDFKLRMIDAAQEEPDRSDFGILEEYDPAYFQLKQRNLPQQTAKHGRSKTTLCALSLSKVEKQISIINVLRANMG